MEAGSKIAAYSSFEYEEANYTLLQPPLKPTGGEYLMPNELKEL